MDLKRMLFKLKYGRVYWRMMQSVACFLVFTLIFNLLAISAAYATPGVAGRELGKEVLQAEVSEIPRQLPDSRLELISQRTPYSTRYLNPDGSFTEEIFLEPRYFQDLGDQMWQEIDNRLVVDPDRPTFYRNQANKFVVQFPQESSDAPILSLEDGQWAIELELPQANPVQAVVDVNQITYPNLFSNVDLSYFVNGDGVKEQLTLHAVPTNKIFTLKVNLVGDLQVILNESGEILFVDADGNLLWYLERPYMEDAVGNYSDQVDLRLRNIHGQLYIDLIADTEFLEDPETIYPVVIDPTLLNWDVQRDTFIASAFPDSSYRSNARMYTGYSSYFGVTRSMVQFYLPALPSDSKITSANFKAYQTRADGNTATVNLHRIESNWATSVDWNTQPLIDTIPESYVTSQQANAYWEWDLTSLMIDWYNAVQPNYGFMLVQENEGASPYKMFNTINAGNYTPQLTINYTVDPIGYEDFWMTTSDSVNPANGNLVEQSTDLSIPGRGLPISLVRTYNSRKSSIPGIFGYGWRSNLEMALADAGAGPITLIDEDSTRHIFGQGITGEYVANPGIYMDLVKHADGTYTLTKPDQVEYHFRTDGKLYSIVEPAGNTLSYFYNGDGKVSMIQDASGRQVNISYGTNGLVSMVTDPANHTIYYHYNSARDLIKYTDAGSNSTSYSYDLYHNVAQITDPRDVSTTITYDANDRVATVSRPLTMDQTVELSTTSYTYYPDLQMTTFIDGKGYRTDYTYNVYGSIIEVTQNPLDPTYQATSTYFYDNYYNLTQVIDPKTNQENGLDAYIYTYDNEGNITGVQFPEQKTAYFNYDQQSNLIQEQDFAANAHWYDYDGERNLLEATDPMIQTAANRYNGVGNLEYFTYPLSVTENLVPNTNFEIDTNGDGWPDEWTRAVQPGGLADFDWTVTSRFGKRAVSISNPTGWALVYSRTVPYEAGADYIVSGYIKTADVTGQAILKLEFFDQYGGWIGQEFALGLQGTQDWTRVQEVVDSIPANTAFLRVSAGLNPGTGTAYFDGIQLNQGSVLAAYNLAENGSFERDLDGNDIPDHWSTSNNLTAEDGMVTIDPLLDNVFAGEHAFKLTGISGVNKYIRQRIPITGDATTDLTLSGWSKQIGADPVGGYYLIQVAINYTDPEYGTDWSHSNDFDPTDEDWQHVVVEVTPDHPFDSIDVYYYYYNQTGTAWFDAMRLEEGATISSYKYDPGQNYITEMINPLGETISYTYDTVGNMISFTDGDLNTTTFEYSENNLLTQVTAPDQSVTRYIYDAGGNMTSLINGKNNQIKYGFNEFDLVSSITDPLAQTRYFDYDQNGNLTEVSYPNNNNVRYSYNKLGRRDGIYYNGVKQWGMGYDRNGNLSYFADNTGFTTTYGYDKNNVVIQKSEGTAHQLDYTYDANYNLTGMQIRADLTTSNRSFEYNQLNLLVGLNWNSEQIADLIYDERDNVISMNLGNNSYAGYRYDEANRLQSVKNYDPMGNLMQAYAYSYDADGKRTQVATSQGTIHYEYDQLDQLVGETLLDGTEISYQYDVVGNRTQKIVTQNGQSLITNYTYDAANQLTSVDGVNYVYDDNGNLLSDGRYTYQYNAENRLTQVSANGVILAAFTYDFEGKRTSKTTSTGTIYYHYDLNGNLVYESDVNNQILAEYIWDDQYRPIAMIRNGDKYFYHYNGHNDVVAMTDETGNTVAEYSYDAWGNIIDQSGSLSSVNPFRYAGYLYDEITGMYYLMARYYDPEIGRFITRDLLDGLKPEPITFNYYVYAKNNPVMYVDYNGYGPIGAVIGAGLGGILGVLVAKYYGLRGWKKALTIAGFAVGGAVIGWFAGPVIARLASRIMPMVYRRIAPEIAKLGQNKVSHIMQSKHAWHLVVKNGKDWNQVARLISYVLKYGKAAPYKTSAMQKTMTIGRHVVVVTYKVIDGVVRVSDGWVRTR